jgi:hypothetical protein
MCQYRKTMLAGNGASELSKPDRKDLRVLVEVLLQELQPMPEGLRDFVQRHIWPSFGGCRHMCAYVLLQSTTG